MATLNISLPAAMRTWINQRISSGAYANASDYMRDLIRHDQREQEALKLALIEGERSGTSKKKVKHIIASTKRTLENA